ncbi:MAG: hypothetical protein D3906_04160 [Candidatus Electrothrix sp. AUS1_2]|nr:hypothetical protein [Candidatus Electrothrix sp. AUS1_2]
MKKTAILFILTASAFLLGGCYIAPVPPPVGIGPAPPPRVYHHPVVVPAPRVVVPLPPPPLYYR